MLRFLLLLLPLGLSYQHTSDETEDVSRVSNISSLATNNSTLLYRFKEVPELPELGDGEIRELYYYEQAIIVRDSNVHNETRRCEVLEVYKEQEVREVLEKLTSKWNLKVQNITMEKMVNLMNDCDMLDKSVKDVIEFDESAVTKVIEKEMDVSSDNSRLSIIVPGTKWCGPGDIADNYHDLGKLRNVDRCCRTHDLCPIKILIKNERYGLKNTAMYTKSHCVCDEGFHDCLKANNKGMAKILKYIYFGVISPDCIKGLPEFPEEGMKFVPATRKW